MPDEPCPVAWPAPSHLYLLAHRLAHLARRRVPCLLTIVMMMLMMMAMMMVVVMVVVVMFMTVRSRG